MKDTFYFLITSLLLFINCKRKHYHCVCDKPKSSITDMGTHSSYNLKKTEDKCQKIANEKGSTCHLSDN